MGRRFRRDAQPYFRIFNPILQGEKFDPAGTYIRRFVPEVARLPDRYVHKPWQSPPDVGADAGAGLAGDYPQPIVEHRIARERALAAFEEMKRAGAPGRS